MCNNPPLLAKMVWPPFTSCDVIAPWPDMTRSFFTKCCTKDAPRVMKKLSTIRLIVWRAFTKTLGGRIDPPARARVRDMIGSLVGWSFSLHGNFFLNEHIWTNCQQWAWVIVWSTYYLYWPYILSLYEEHFLVLFPELTPVRGVLQRLRCRGLVEPPSRPAFDGVRSLKKKKERAVLNKSKQMISDFKVLGQTVISEVRLNFQNRY